MFLGPETSFSVTQIAGAEAVRLSDDPNALVVLMYTKLWTPVEIAASSKASVPVTFVSMNSRQLCVATCGLCSVAA